MPNFIDVVNNILTSAEDNLSFDDFKKLSSSS
jgi:hypothetical protein